MRWSISSFASTRRCRQPVLSYVVGRLRYAVPQWREELRPALFARGSGSPMLARGGADWYWPADESPDQQVPADEVRLLAPFDPVVWDRRRFELLWGWGYRFEAYTPASKRKLGYYALPLLWRDRIIGWANLSVAGGTLDASFGYAGSSRPRERSFARALDEELAECTRFSLWPPTRGRSAAGLSVQPLLRLGIVR